MATGSGGLAWLKYGEHTLRLLRGFAFQAGLKLGNRHLVFISSYQKGCLVNVDWFALSLQQEEVYSTGISACYQT